MQDGRDKIPNNSSQRDNTKDGQVWLKPVKMLQQLVVLKENWCMDISRTHIEEADCQTRLVSCTVHSQECVLLYWRQAKNEHDCWD